MSLLCNNVPYNVPLAQKPLQVFTVNMHCTRFLVTVMIMLTVLLPRQFVQSRTGISYDTALSTDDWSSLLGSSTSIPQISFAIIHAYFYNNTLNPNVVYNINNAWASGIRDISIYIYPCINSSVNSQTSKLNCGVFDIAIFIARTYA